MGALTIPSGTLDGVLGGAATASGAPASASAQVTTSETTTSGDYTNLATSGPAVTLTTGTKVLVIVSTWLRNSQSDGHSYMDFEVSGATSRSASDQTALLLRSTVANFPFMRASSASFLTVTAGSNTFTAKYRKGHDGTATFQDRQITVIDLGS